MLAWRQQDEFVCNQDYLAAAEVEEKLQAKAAAIATAQVAQAATSSACQGKEQNAAAATGQGKRQDVDSMGMGQNAKDDKPLLDPPEIDEECRIRDTEETPHWIPGAFPSIFQNETGDPYNYLHKKPDLLVWGPHVLRSRGWAAQAHMTFMYWWMNMCQRFKALGAKKWFVKDNPKATGYTADDIKSMNVGMLSKKMVGYTQNIPGSRACARHACARLSWRWCGR